MNTSNTGGYAVPREYIERLLKLNEEGDRRVCKALGMSLKAIDRFAKRMGLDPDDFKVVVDVLVSSSWEVRKRKRKR